MSEPEKNMPVCVIPDEGERLRPNENSEKSIEFKYRKKDADTDTSLYDRVLNSLKKLYAFYNPTIKNMHEPVIEVNYKVMGDTRVILIVEHENEKLCGREVRLFLRMMENLRPSRKR